MCCKCVIDGRVVFIDKGMMDLLFLEICVWLCFVVCLILDDYFEDGYFILFF